MGRIVKFILSIIKNGRVKPRGIDYTVERNKNLSSLQDFIPKRASNFRQENSTLQLSSIRYLLGQFGAIKVTLYERGGHLYSPKHNLAYIRIPKSGSTSFCFILLKEIYEGLSSNLTAEQFNYLADANLITTCNSSTTTYFTAVRNPFARLVSVYREFFESQNKPFLYADYLFGIFNQNMSFTEFINQLAVIPDTLKDQHIKPQYLFLKWYNKNKIPVKYLKLEEPNTISSFLSTYSLNAVLLNKSEPYDYTAYFTPYTLSIAYKIYKVDLETFDYLDIYTELKARIT